MYALKEKWKISEKDYKEIDWEIFWVERYELR